VVEVSMMRRHTCTHGRSSNIRRVEKNVMATTLIYLSRAVIFMIGTLTKVLSIKLVTS
jgi:hypothetical protein